MHSKNMAIGTNITKRIIRPRFNKMPHRTSSLAPNAYEVKVSCAQLVPIINDSPTMLIKVEASPTPAVIAGFPKVPIKAKQISCEIKFITLVTIDGIASLRNIVAILEFGQSGESLNSYYCIRLRAELPIESGELIRGLPVI